MVAARSGDDVEMKWFRDQGALFPVLQVSYYFTWEQAVCIIFVSRICLGEKFRL